MTNNQSVITKSVLEHLIKSIEILHDSYLSVPDYKSEKEYNSKEREPFDALSDRFVRAVEISIKFFRSYEKLLFAENSETLRDLLGKMEKLEIITSVELWFQMRDIRNRIVHEYLPEELKEIYGLICGIYKNEFLFLNKKLSNVTLP